MSIGDLINILYRWMPTIAEFIVMVCPLILSFIALLLAHWARQDCIELKKLNAEQKEIIIKELQKINEKP